MDHSAPLTPVRDPPFIHSMIQDSPFSDYFTDDSRSVDHNKSTFSMPPPDTQRLLLRLNDLGAQILRHDPSSHSISALSNRLDALEDALTAPVSQSRQPANLVDSGLFMEEDLEEEEAQTPHEEPTNNQDPFGLDGTTDILHTRLNDVQELTHAAQSRFLQESGELLERVTKANRDLRARFDEMQKLNDEHMLQLEDTTREVLKLRSETEALKADLGFDHSELLFLKLQLKALEVQADALLMDDSGRDGEEERRKRVLLSDDMEQWKADWDDVDARLRGRREKHNVTSSTPKKMAASREDGKSADEKGDWKLDFCKKRMGRVHSITIKRTDSLGLDGTKDDEATMVTAEHEGEDSSAYREQGTQTNNSVVDEDETIGELLEDEEDEVENTEPEKTAWQEFCENFAALAGVKSQ